MITIDPITLAGAITFENGNSIMLGDIVWIKISLSPRSWFFIDGLLVGMSPQLNSKNPYLILLSSPSQFYAKGYTVAIANWYCDNRVLAKHLVEDILDYHKSQDRNIAFLNKKQRDFESIFRSDAAFAWISEKEIHLPLGNEQACKIIELYHNQ